MRKKYVNLGLVITLSWGGTLYVAAANPSAAVVSREPGQTTPSEMVQILQQPVPEGTYETFKPLDAAKLTAPDNTAKMPYLNRYEGAILTARSYERLQEAKGRGSDTAQVEQAVASLMEEFRPEVAYLGYGSMTEAKQTIAKVPEEWDWQVYGEVRYNLAINRGAPQYTWSDSRYRLRLYGKKKISDHINVYGMIESDRSHVFDAADEAVGRHSSNDGNIELSRVYLEGLYEWWKIPFTIEAGETYAYLGDGNILDSDFHGVKLMAEPDAYTRIQGGIGKVNDSESMQYVEAWRKQKEFDYMGGIYHWDNYGSPVGIVAGGTNYYTGNYTFGAVYLYASRADGSGDRDGYVLTARYGQNMSWIPHTYEFDLKYYNQAGKTYINHTMNGVGGYMDGFTGWGAMVYYTLQENLLFSVQYYDIDEKATGWSGRTVWTELTWSF